MEAGVWFLLMSPKTRPCPRNGYSLTTSIRHYLGILVLANILQIAQIAKKLLTPEKKYNSLRGFITGWFNAENICDGSGIDRPKIRKKDGD